MLESILKNILAGLYTQIGAALLVSILFMIVWKTAKESSWKQILKDWINGFRTNKKFRQDFFLILFAAMILFRTILCRSVWSTSNPLKHVIGIWGLEDEKGNLYIDGILNCILFIPFTMLLMNRSEKASILKAGWYSFLFSLGIETMQLLLKCGEFQLSDIFYNTLGGLIGGILYWGYSKVWKNE